MGRPMVRRTRLRLDRHLAPDTAGDARAGRIHACQRHYAFHIETTIDAILHDPEHMAATNDEQRRTTVLRHIIAFGRE